MCNSVACKQHIRKHTCMRTYMRKQVHQNPLSQAMYAYTHLWQAQAELPARLDSPCAKGKLSRLVGWTASAHSLPYLD
eukprot:jgi/Botrbrau1/6503/Bobra.0034s0076.1